MESNKAIINTIDKEGRKLQLYMRTFGHKVLQDAQMVYNVKLTSLIKRSVSGDEELFSKQQLDQHLSSLGIWTDSDSREFLRLQLELRSLELKLKRGGIKVSVAKKIALEMKTKRAILLLLYNRRAQFDGLSMESLAENHRFKFLLVQCIVTVESDVPLFFSMEDYEEKQNDQYAIDAATALAGKLYGYDKETEANLVENKWLQKFEFADDKGRLVDKDKKLIDMDGHLINEEGRFIDKDGNFVDDKGRPVDDVGNFVVETQPFIDDETNEPIIENTKKNKKKNKRLKKVK